MLKSIRAGKLCELCRGVLRSVVAPDDLGDPIPQKIDFRDSRIAADVVDFGRMTSGYNVQGYILEHLCDNCSYYGTF